MKRILIAILLLVVSAGAFLYFGGAERLGLDSRFGATTTDDTAAAPTPQDEPLPPVRSTGAVIADAAVVPVQYAALSMPIGGVVAEVLRNEGDPVESGDVILRLKQTREQASIAQARAALFRAQAQMEELTAGARPEEIAGAQAAVDSATARLAQLSEPARAAEIEAAQAELTAAQAALNALYRGPTTTEEAAFKAELADTEARLSQARSNYSEVAWRNDVARLPESVALQETTNAYEAAKARYDNLFAAPQADAVTAARARIQSAQAEIDRLQTPGTAGQIAEAEAEVRRNQAILDQLEAGARTEEIARIGADIADANARLMEAEAALTDTELVAPFSGTLAFLDVKAGEQVAAGTIVAQLADLSRWQIETSDLTEISIVNVQEGDRVQLTFDAISDLEIGGTVVRIRPIGENKQGDIVYTVIIEPDTQDSRLRWNMTAVATIEQ